MRKSIAALICPFAEVVPLNCRAPPNEEQRSKKSIVYFYRNSVENVKTVVIPLVGFDKWAGPVSFIRVSYAGIKRN